MGVKGGERLSFSWASRASVMCYDADAMGGRQRRGKYGSSRKSNPDVAGHSSNRDGGQKPGNRCSEDYAEVDWAVNLKEMETRRDQVCVS